MCETAEVASTVDISADAGRLGTDLPRACADHSTDPLQGRRAELIDHYDRHGYPERARYLERQPNGRGLLRRAGELGRLDGKDRSDAAVALARDMLAYWTGWPEDSWERLAVPFAALAEFTERAGRVERDQRASPDARERSRALVKIGCEVCRPLADTIAAMGLWARVNTYLTPIGVPTADSICFTQVAALRIACGSYAPLRIASPGPDTAAPFMVVCERCSLVDATVRAANRCRMCAKARPRREGAFRLPITHPEMAWLVTGDRIVYLHTCEECGEQFVAQRASARTCSPACRVARARKRHSLKSTL